MKRAVLIASFLFAAACSKAPAAAPATSAKSETHLASVAAPAAPSQEEEGCGAHHAAMAAAAAPAEEEACGAHHAAAAAGHGDEGCGGGCGGGCDCAGDKGDCGGCGAHAGKADVAAEKGGCGMQAPTTTTASTTTATRAFDRAPKAGDKATCVVMNREFVVDDKTVTSVHQGKHYAFCCDGCKEKFDAAPQQFTQLAAR